MCLGTCEEVGRHRGVAVGGTKQIGMTSGGNILCVVMVSVT